MVGVGNVFSVGDPFFAIQSHPIRTHDITMRRHSTSPQYALIRVRQYGRCQ